MPSAGIILRMQPANGRRRYIVMLSLIGWAHSQNDPCIRQQAITWPTCSLRSVMNCGLTRPQWVKIIQRIGSKYSKYFKTGFIEMTMLLLNIHLKLVEDYGISNNRAIPVSHFARNRVFTGRLHNINSKLLWQCSDSLPGNIFKWFAVVESVIFFGFYEVSPKVCYSWPSC